MGLYLFECIDCGKKYLPIDVQYLCPLCSGGQKEMEPLKGIFRCIYDYGSVSKSFSPRSLSKNKKFGFARWLHILPVKHEGSFPPLINSFTPLRAAENLRRDFNLEKLWLKDDTVQPTASFKDRASALVVACAHELGLDTIATASTGNAATALAGQAASVGMKSVIFVPEKAPPAKLAQIAVFGATLIPVKGTYDEAFELSIESCKKFGWYNRNTAYNPFTIEGKKTAALEIWEQLGFKPPDWVVVPTGDGVILAGIEKGFADLKNLGLIERVPRLAVVQAKGCQPIVCAWKNKTIIKPELKPQTVADSIAVGVPRAGRWVIEALERNRGACVAVDDEEILEAIAFLGRTTGVFAEPAAATAVAGLKKLVEDKTIEKEDVVIVLVTGSGLKDVGAASRAVKIPKAIDPTLHEVQRVLAI